MPAGETHAPASRISRLTGSTSLNIFCMASGAGAGAEEGSGLMNAPATEEQA